MRAKTDNKTGLTTIGIDRQTNRLIDKLCKRYALKKGEIVRLAFAYMDKACINPAEAPESTKTELSKINKRQDDIIRFIRSYEEEKLNPMIRATNSIAVRFDNIVKDMEMLILSQLEKSQERYQNVLLKISKQFKNHADVINNQGKQVTNFSQVLQSGNKKIFQLIYLYSELAACGVMDGKRKENLKSEIICLINEKQE